MSKPPRWTEHDKVQAIVHAVEDYPIAESAAWGDLDALSAQTVVDGIEVDPEGVTVDRDGRFRGVSNVYVGLQYGSGEDGFETSDGFLARFEGHFDEVRTPVIDKFTVDTSPFYQ